MISHSHTKTSHASASFPLIIIVSLLLSSPLARAGAFNCRSSFRDSGAKTRSSLPSLPPSSLRSLFMQLPSWNIPRGGGELLATHPTYETFHDSAYADSGNDGLSMELTSASSVKLFQESSTFPTLSTVISLLQSAGSSYARLLTLYPVLTKSFTAGFIFGFSDWIAQIIEQKKQKVVAVAATAKSSTTSSSESEGRSRIVASFLVGTLFFGPAAHAWYAAIFALLPSTTLPSTLTKAALGQVIFGPVFTCVYFLANMLSRPNGFHSFTFKSYTNKITSDLPTVWMSGLGYWPLVDLLGYAYVNPNYMPLYVNGASFLWTVYLSGITNKK